VPLTTAWHDERILLATERTAPTGRNIERCGRARIALGSTRDVVMIDAVLDRTEPAAEAGTPADGYAAQSDWDPREAGPGYVYLVLRPHRIQAWREADELAGRLLMRDGAWLS